MYACRLLLYYMLVFCIYVCISNGKSMHARLRLSQVKKRRKYTYVCM